MDKYKGKADKLPCFRPWIWSKYYKELHTIKLKVAQNKNKKRVDAKDWEEDNEVQALGAVCMRDGTREAIVFFLNKCIYHLSARTCEATSQIKQNLRHEELQEDKHKYNILKLSWTETRLISRSIG